jgi:hypothetical protein
MHDQTVGDILRDKYGGFKGKQTVLQRVQTYLDARYGAGRCVVALEHDQFILQVASSALAGQVRLHQTSLLTALRELAPEHVGKKLRIRLL